MNIITKNRVRSKRLLALFLIPVMAIANRVRGGGFQFKPTQVYWVFRKILQFSMGAYPAYIITQWGYMWVICGVLFIIGERFGWRELFDELSYKKPEQDNLFERFMWRGFVWSLFVLPLTYFNYLFFIYTSMALALPLGAYWGYRWQDKFDKHAFAELAIGGIFGLLMAAILLII